MQNKWKGVILLAVVALATLPLAMHFTQQISGASKASGSAQLAPRGTWTRPFENDPQVIGDWKTVDFVERIENFKPGQKAWRGGDFVFPGLSFKADGSTSDGWIWTKGYMWLQDNNAEGKYETKDLDGKKYLFMEWINGDVLKRGAKPWYYVFEKI